MTPTCGFDCSWVRALPGGWSGPVSRALLRDPAVLWPVLLDQTRSITGAQFAVLALERQDTGTLDVVASRGIGGQAALSFLPGLLAASTDGRLHVAGDHPPAGVESGA